MCHAIFVTTGFLYQLIKVFLDQNNVNILIDNDYFWSLQVQSVTQYVNLTLLSRLLNQITWTLGTQIRRKYYTIKNFYETIAYFIILTHFIVNSIMNVSWSNRAIKLDVHYSTCAIMFWLVPGFSQKNLGYFQNVFFSITMKIKLKSTLYFDFCFV